MNDKEIKTLVKSSIATVELKLSTKIKEATKTQEEDAPVEFDCPICKHVTLAKQCKTVSVYGYFSSYLNGQRHCYTCGRYFEMITKTKWVEIK